MARHIQYQPVTEPFVPAAAPDVPSVASWTQPASIPRRRAWPAAALALSLAFVPVSVAVVEASAPVSGSGLVRRPRVVQYQALVRPLLDIAPPVVAPEITPPVYPDWIARKTLHPSRMPAWFFDAQYGAPTPPFVPDVFRFAVFPDAIDRKRLPVAAMPAFAIDAQWDAPVIVAPTFFRFAVYPDRIDRKVLPVAAMPFWVSDPRWLPPTPPQPVTHEVTIPIRRLRRAPHLSHEDRWTFYKSLEIDLETGIGLDGTQQGTDPQIMLRWSDDDGETWSNEKWVSAGRIGEYFARAHWQRLGRGRDRIFEIVVSDPVAWQIVAAYLDVEGGES